MSQTIGGKDSLRKRGNMKTFSIACGGLESGEGGHGRAVSIGSKENRAVGRGESGGRRRRRRIEGAKNSLERSRTIRVDVDLVRCFV